MSARYYLQSHTTKQFVKDKTRKLLVPSTIGLFVFQWLLGIYNLKIGGGLNIAGLPMPILYLITVLSGVGPLWYIQMLWLFSMLLLVVRKIEKDRVWNFCSKAPVWSILMLTIVVYGSAQVLNTPVVTVYRFGMQERKKCCWWRRLITKNFSQNWLRQCTMNCRHQNQGEGRRLDNFSTRS